MRKFNLVYRPHAQTDLAALERRFALQILEDLEILTGWPWPAGKVKQLHGCDFSEIKTGNYRTIFWQDGADVVIVRIVNRRDLERAIGGINHDRLTQWLNDRREQERKAKSGRRGGT